MSTKKFYISRDVTFHESVFPFQSQTQSQSDSFHDLVISHPLPDASTSPPLQPLPEQSAPPLQPNREPTTNINPIPHQNPEQPTITAPARRSQRSVRPPAYLADYACNSITPYPIANFCSYGKLSSAYRTFINQISTVYEPQFFHQAVKISRIEAGYE